MGHVWTWLESKGELFSESEKSSCCQESSNSSLDLELIGWRENEETTEVELEESSSQEEDSQLDSGDLAAWEKDSERDSEEPGRYNQEALLRFLSEVTKLMEPLCISSTNLEPAPQTFSSSGEQNERGASTHKEGIKRSLVHKDEEAVGEESPLQILKREARGNSVPQRSEKWALQVSEGPVLVNWKAEGIEELQDLRKEKGDYQVQDSKCEGQKVLNILEESVGEMKEDEEYSPEHMVQIPHYWRTLGEEVPLNVKEEVAVENTEEQAEDWKDSDLHLSYTNDDSSPWGTPQMSSPSTSIASLPLMQPNQDDSLQQCLLFKKTLLSIWKMVAGHRPVDLSSIKRRISKGQIQNMVQFQRDLMLMFQNAIMYNNSNHHIHRIAMEMEQEVLEQLQMLGEALLCTEEMQGFVRRC
ncbi:bromodomain-containing protein 8 isoform X2 [Pogona vitticeps]